MSHEDVAAFVYAVPWLTTRADPDLRIEIYDVAATAPNDLVVGVHVWPRAVSDELADQSRRLGVADPIASQAALDLMMWIAALRRIGDSPLHAAWTKWRSSRSVSTTELPERVPVMLLEYSIGPPRPSLSPSPSSVVDSAQNVTPSVIAALTQYDGPTQTST